MNENTSEKAESERVTLAREMFEMLKGHTLPSSGTTFATARRLQDDPPQPTPHRLSAHDVHELADGAARLIAATNGLQLNGRPLVAQKREGA